MVPPWTRRHLRRRILSAEDAFVVRACRDAIPAINARGRGDGHLSLSAPRDGQLAIAEERGGLSTSE